MSDVSYRPESIAPCLFCGEVTVTYDDEAMSWKCPCGRWSGKLRLNLPEPDETL